MWAQTSIENFLSSPWIKYANVSVSIHRLSTGETIDSYRPCNLISPASTMKLFTTATVLELLGNDYRIPTYLKYSGQIKDGVLNGNLYIVGHGDPTLGGKDWGGDAFLNQWVKIIQQAGIQRIEGAVVGDCSYYDGDAVNPGWIYEDIGNYYAPGIFALAYLDNTVNIQLKSGPINTVAHIIRTYPTIPHLTFENHIRCTQIDYDGAYVHGLPYQNCRYLTGSIPSNLGVFGVRGDMPNPPLLLAQHLTARLQNKGVVVRDSATYCTETDGKNKTVLYTHYSKPLAEIVEQTNLHSNNLNAEMLFRNLGEKRDVPCTIKNSSDYIKQFWSNRGVDIFMTRILDGCGLSPQNGVSAENFVQLLQYMSNSKEKAAFIRSLPTSGRTGTLKTMFVKTALEGKVHAKSGTIKGTRNYAGYIDMPDGDKLVFAVLVSDSNGSGLQIRHAIEQYLLDVYRRNK